jgi:hypothetical protein
MQYSGSLLKNGKQFAHAKPGTDNPHCHHQNFENDGEGNRYLVWRVRLVPEDSIPMPKHVGIDTFPELYFMFKLPI